MHIVDKYGSFINHSFQPNVSIQGNLIIAIKNINIQDEITFNYNESEINMACPFEIDGQLICGINEDDYKHSSPSYFQIDCEYSEIIEENYDDD